MSKRGFLKRKRAGRERNRFLRLLLATRYIRDVPMFPFGFTRRPYICVVDGIGAEADWVNLCGSTCTGKERLFNE